MDKFISFKYIIFFIEGIYGKFNLLCKKLNFMCFFDIDQVLYYIFFENSVIKFFFNF